MSVARLAENIMLDRGDRFALFYGNVNDEFYDDDLVCGSIDFMLWRYFCQEQGYQRVVFFHGADKITFYDEQSRRACLPEQPPVAGSRPSATSSLKGPLGRRKLLSHQSSIGSDGRSSPQVAAISDPSPQADASRPQRRMSDLSALEILDFIIRNDADSLATAVIFPLAEDIRRFEGASLREIQNRMLRWIRVSSKVPRICVFVFQQTTEEEVEEIAKSYELHIVYNFIKQKRGDNANMVRVGYPDAQEILNLLHHYRLRVGLKVDWSILDDMAQFLCNQRLPMKRLNSMLAAVHGLNRDTLRAWSKTGRIRSTEYLIENIGKEMRMDTGHLIEQLSSVHCQEDSTAQLVNAVAEWHALIEKKKPLTLFLAGTSGVGKTYTVELLAEALQHLGYEYCYFAMTEFSQEHAVSNLIGSPKGYVGSEDEPKLFEALHRSKKLIICFDEIEKAHDKIIKALMQLMEKGFLSWSKGEEDFRECIICFTSNAQMQKVVDLKHRFVRNGKQTDGPEFQNAIRDVLVQAQIAPEVCGRINRFLVYSPLTPEAIVRITHQEVNKLARGYGLEVIYTAPEFLAEVAEKTANSMYGARPVQNEVSSRLGKAMLSLKKQEPEARKVLIKRTGDVYQAVSVEGVVDGLSYDGMIEHSMKLISLNDRPAGRAATDSGTQPKRLLRLHEIPTSLSKRKPRSAASSPLESIRPAVGYVKVEQADGTEGSGSGFVITPDGRFITSFHVVENAQSIRVRFDDYPDTWFGAELLDADKQADIAVLKLEGGKFTWVLMTPYGDKVELGESVGLLGYPLGEDLGNLVTYTAGVVSSYREGPGGTSLFQIDASAYNGSSGGPLLRLRDGRVIGILMGGWKEAAGLNLAVSIDELYKRLVREY